MQFVKKLWGGVCLLSLLVLGACAHSEPEILTDEQDDAYYASLASIISDSPYFMSTDDGGAISFNTEGGSVAVSVECGTDWTVENHATDIFDVEWDCGTGTMTVSAAPNTLEQELTGTISVVTAAQKILFATITVTQSAYGAPTITLDSNTWHAPAAGALSADFSIEASADWDVATEDAWLSAVKAGDDSFTVFAFENEETSRRSGTVVVTCSDGISKATDYISVTQDGKAYITVDRTRASLTGEEQTTQFAVESNFEWDFTCSSTGDWITAVATGVSLTVSVTQNDGDEEREGTISLIASDGAENVAEAVISIKQDVRFRSMVLTYKTTSSNQTVALPLYGTISCMVDWGDGSDIQSVSASSPSHVYASQGEYDVIISGTVTGLNSYNGGTPASLVAVKQWGDVGLTSLTNAFYTSTNLLSLPDYTGNYLSSVTDFTSAFRNCSSLQSIPADLFGNCPLVTGLTYTFKDCSSLTEIPKGLFDNCSQMNTFSYTFQDCSMIQDIPAGLFDNCPNVKTFNQTFYGCLSIRSIPEGLFDHNTNVTEFSFTFYDCTSIRAIPSGLFDNCPLVNNIEYLFRGCTSLEAIPEHIFDKLPEVTKAQYLFYYCSSLESIPEELFYYNTKISKLQNSFQGCSSLKEIPAGLFSKCPEVTSFTSAFLDCTSLTEIPSGLFDNNTKVTTFNSVFRGCPGLTSIPDGIFKNCTAVTGFAYSFADCPGLSYVPADLFSACTAVTDFQFVFQNCTSLESIPENFFSKCTKVINFNGTFSGCTSLTSVPTSLFDNCMSVTKFTETFNECTALTGESPYTEFYDGVETVKVHLYERKDFMDQLGCSQPSVYSNCFAGCEHLDDYYDIPSSWGG